jgi:NAD/NADP transhydrogenase beta subunit
VQITNILVGLVVVVLLIWRQVKTRPAQESSAARLVLILGVVGVITTVNAFNSHSGHHASGGTIGWIVVSLVVAAAFGAVRATTVQVWRDPNGVAWRRGTWLTAALWIVAIAAHLGLDVVIDHASGINGLGTATIYLYLAVSLGVQRELIRARIPAAG